MWAAAEGRSKLGIPKSVGEEFVKSDSAGKPDLGDLTDFEAMEAVRDGELPSPTQYGDFWLFDLRITGTGAAYREALKEYAFRDPEKWLSDEFLKRCNGLPVVFGHPENSGLNSEEFRERSLGSIMLPYIKGEEVWGIAKIFDADAAKLMQTTHRSTSPGVLPPKGSTPTSLENGKKVLDEGLPLVLDHLAVCDAGVWDKSGPPEGVRLDSTAAKEHTVTEEERKKLEEERDDAKRRADAAESELKKEREDRARRDAEETERQAIEKAEKEKADKARSDRKKRHDSEKHEGQHDDCARCDSDEKKEKDLREAEEAGKKEREAEERARRDGAKVEDVNANQIKELHDARRHDSKTIAELQAQVDALTKQMEPPTIDERNAVAAAYHRFDSVYQMLGNATPLSLPGEKPLAYRRRLADGLRSHSPQWKDHPLNDSLVGPAYDLVENAILADALNMAKNPVINDSAGRLREVTTTKNGKTYSEFYGDPRKAWEPFMPPMRNVIKKFETMPARQ